MPEASASVPGAGGLTVLGFDFGTRRIGVAIGNGLTGGARPLRVLDGAGSRHWDDIAELLRQWQPGRLVVGVPRHPDGNPHEMTTRCERFARQLEGRYGLPVERVDERYSSAVLEGAGRGAARDDESAALIVQQWFDEHPAPRSSP